MAVLRSVAKTDTFERQRQIINQIAQDLFEQVGAGDTDLAAGNIKLGDGTKTSPSLSFTSQSSLGVYKPSGNTLGIAGSGGDVAYFSDNINFYKPVSGIQKVLIDSGLSISNVGQNYDSGSYTDVSVSGGFGSDGSLDIEVVGLDGTYAQGSGYTNGSYSNARLSGGTGSGAVVSFDVNGLNDVGTITNAGTGYTEGQYSSVSFSTSSGSGSGAVGDVVVNASGEVESVFFLNQGSNYAFGSVLTVSSADVGGTGSGFEFTLGATPAIVENLTFDFYGSGYTIGDTLTLPSSVSIVGSTTDASQSISVSDARGIVIGSFISGSGIPSSPPSSVISVDLEANTFEISQPATATNNNINLTLTPPYGGSGFSYTVSGIGVISSVSVNNPGNGYEPGDVLTVDAGDLIQPIVYEVTVSPLQELVFQSTASAGSISVGDNLVTDDGLFGPFPVVQVNTSGSNITNVVIDVSSSPNGFTENALLVRSGTTTPTFQLTTGDQTFYNRYFINGDLHPSLTLYAGSLYNFEYSAALNEGHPFRLSRVPDGVHTSVTGLTATITSASLQVTVSDTTGILPGMGIIVQSGTGSFSPTATVVSIDSGTQVTLSEVPLTAGTAVVDFIGVEFTADYVIKGDDFVNITPDATTPTLYYYCITHPDMAGTDGLEAVLTIDQNNPKVFGSNGAITVTANQESEIFKIDSFTGTTSISRLSSTNSTIQNLISTTATSSTYTASTYVDTPLLQNTATLAISTPILNVTGETTNFGPNIQVSNSLGKIELNTIVAGDIQVDTFLNIDNNRIYTTSTNDLTLQAEGTGRIVKVDGNTAFAVPVGTTLERPVNPVVRLGAIRYNTTTSQYEGYLGANNWSSLGGVRDIDGNTKILAEEGVGTNDNKLWFYNDGSLSARLTTDWLEFINTNSLRSIDPSTPEFKEWVPNDPVTTGEYVKYRNNLFQVTGANGVNGTLATPPTNTSGTAFVHGTTEYTFISIAVRDLILTEATAVKIGPTKDVPLIVSDEIKILDNDISSLSQDLFVVPAPDKKVVFNCPTSIVIPVGGSGDRGIPAQGSIRYNTTITQFEGYNGSSWSSLGGVRDVDGDTYIAPELTPGGDQDTLYFVNQDKSTLEITTTAFNFGEVDTIQSSITNQLNVSVANVTFGDSTETSIDHNDNGLFTDRVYISTTKASLQLGVSAGLTNRPMFRITETGEFQSNALALSADLPFWATFTNIIGSTLQQRDFGYTSNRFELVKGTNETFNINIYDNQVTDSCIVEIQAHITNGSYEKEYIQFVVTDNKTNILYNEISSLQTGANLISNIVFEFESPNLSGATLGNVRVTGSLDSNIANGDAVRFVILKRAIKNVAII